MKKIAILGCGPTGLTLAQSIHHFAKAFGLDVDIKIVSEKEPSYIAGAQYLHEPIPEIHTRQPDTLISVRKNGTREGYAQKVYGSPDAPVSWDRYDDMLYEAWNMRKSYDALWEAWESRVVHAHLTPEHSAQAATQGHLEGLEPDVVLNTVPLNALCLRNGSSRVADGPEHFFKRQVVHIIQREGQEVDQDFILYNGETEPSWYRRSIIFGTEALEWSAQGPKPPMDGVVTIRKPVGTTCDCFGPGQTVVPWINLGRYGAYDKNYLSHHAIYAARELASALSSEQPVHVQ